ncbi:MAG: hypothetical protein CMO44_14945 [Verrucomicrobiales bacterium]|nr:hypothetical protein [Verrucomicrobiales bacterium]
MWIIQMSGRRGPPRKKTPFSRIRNRNKIKKEKEKEKEEKKKSTDEDKEGLVNQVKQFLEILKRLPKNVLYCENVGDGYLDGPLYKGLASFIVGSIYVYFVRYFNSVMEGYFVDTAKYFTNVTYLNNLASWACAPSINNKITGFWLSNPLTSSTCGNYLLNKQSIKNWINDCISYVVLALLSLFGFFVNKNEDGVLITKKSWKEWLNNFNFAPGKVGEKIPVQALININDIICTVAKMIERLLNYTCQIKKKEKQDLIKTLSSELRLFDNSIKF